MNSSLRQLRTIWMALLASIAIYFLVALHAPARSEGTPVMLFALAATSFALAVVVFVIRRKMLAATEALAASHPDDKVALSRWRTAYIIVWALCEMIAMYGLVLRYLGFSIFQAAPFFASGFLLILLQGPRRPEPAV
jgi:hypothetical protein